MPVRVFNKATAQTARLASWVRRYPARAAGWGYLPPTAAFIGSGIFKLTQGEVGSGIFLIGAGMAEVAACAALIRYGDPEISAAQASAHKEIQDSSLWHRLTSPRQAPHEFGAIMGIASTTGLALSAVAHPTPAAVVMATSCVAVVAAQMMAEKSAKDLASAQTPTNAFNRLARRGFNWMQEKPLRAVFWTAMPCNIAQMVDGWLRKDVWMFASGAAFMAVNGLRSLSSKRTRIVGDSPTAAGSPTP